MNSALRALIFVFLGVAMNAHARRDEKGLKDVVLLEPAEVNHFRAPAERNAKAHAAATSAEDLGAANVFPDMSLHMRITGERVRSSIDQSLDQLIERFAKRDRDAFIKTSAKGRANFQPPEGCWIARVYNHPKESTELQMVSPESIKLVSHTMLKAICTAGDPKGVLAPLLKPGSNEGDALQSKLPPPRGMTPLAQTAALSFGVALQESHASPVAGFHADGGVSELETAMFQSSPNLVYAAGEFDPEGAERMTSLALDYHNKMMLIARDRSLLKESGIDQLSGMNRLKMGIGLRQLGISRDPEKEFDKLCGVKAFDPKSFWYAGADFKDPKIAEEVAGLETQLAQVVSEEAKGGKDTRSKFKEKKLALETRLAQLKSAQKLANAWRNDARSVRVTEAKHGESKALTAKLRRIANGINDQDDPPISYAAFGLEQMEAAALTARPGFERIAGGLKITSDYLSGDTKGKDVSEGSKVASAIRTMNFFCPKFAAEMNALGIRYQYKHYGPTKRGEVKSNCRNYFAALEKEFISAVGNPAEESRYCKALLGADGDVR